MHSQAPCRTQPGRLERGPARTPSSGAGVPEPHAGDPLLTRVQQRAGLVAWGALALLQVVWHAWLLPPARTPVAAALVIGLVPLAIPLLYRRRPRRALLMAGMVSLFYFCHGVAEAWVAPGERVLASVEIALSVLLILANARRPGRRRTAADKLYGP